MIENMYKAFKLKMKFYYEMIEKNKKRKEKYPGF